MAKPGVPESTMSKPVGAAPPPPDPAPQPGASAARTSPVRVPPPPTLPEPQAAPAPPVAPPAATAQPERIAPPPASDKSTQPAAVETAARAPEAAPTAPAGPGDLVRVLFDAGSAKLPADSRDSLQTLAVKLQDDENLRLQIEAYAQGTSDTASQARRLSLSRALAVRAYLIEKGVRSTRMDVRALGTKPSDPPAPSDRVDARLVER
jgi:outer membrane protein OmpA-like peptidoglycan-associated protein